MIIKTLIVIFVLRSFYFRSLCGRGRNAFSDKNRIVSKLQLHAKNRATRIRLPPDVSRRDFLRYAFRKFAPRSDNDSNIGTIYLSSVAYHCLFKIGSYRLIQHVISACSFTFWNRQSNWKAKITLWNRYILIDFQIASFISMKILCGVLIKNRIITFIYKCIDINFLYARTDRNTRAKLIRGSRFFLQISRVKSFVRIAGRFSRYIRTTEKWVNLFRAVRWNVRPSRETRSRK